MREVYTDSSMRISTLKSFLEPNNAPDLSSSLASQPTSSSNMPLGQFDFLGVKFESLDIETAFKWDDDEGEGLEAAKDQDQGSHQTIQHPQT